jgi:hypothetical protein
MPDVDNQGRYRPVTAGMWYHTHLFGLEHTHLHVLAACFAEHACLLSYPGRCVWMPVQDSCMGAAFLR